MIEISNVEVVGWESAIRGMRNPLNSWDKSDSKFIYGGCDYCTVCMNSDECAKYISISNNGCIKLGTNDLELMKKLAKAGSDHRKYMRMITVYADINAPLYWWKEYDTYKVGTVANSCSTMHKIAEKEFTLDDFSHEQLLTNWNDDNEIVAYNGEYSNTALDILEFIIEALNHYRKLYLETKNKKYWWQMIQLLPSSYNQRRTVMLNYEVLANIYRARKNHKLDEWRDLCKWIESLPYSEIITVKSE